MKPFVSIIIPCRNEVDFIGPCLDSILEGNYPADRMEILVVDGLSEDETRLIVEGYAKRHPSVKLLSNPKKITPAALNTGLSAARGDLIMRIDAHSHIGKDYVSGCVETLTQLNVDCVGGTMKTLPQKPTLLGKAIAMALSHRFGVGNSDFKVDTPKPRDVDTLFNGCYKRNVFEKVGPFNERLVRGQDMEFSLRIKKAGGRIVLDPSIASYYRARSGLKTFLKQSWLNGMWAILPMTYTTIMPVSLRHLVPAVFVASLLGSFLASFFWRPAMLAGTVALLCYAVANIGASLAIAVRQRNARYAPILPFVFAGLHFSYGLGSCWALVKMATKQAPKSAL